MKIITGATGKEHVLAEDDRSLNASIADSGMYVLDIGNKLNAVIQSSNNILIESGDILFNGTHARVTTGETLVIDNGTVGYNRLDMIVARYTNSNGVESMELAVIKGEPSQGTATEPAYTEGNIIEGSTTAEMPLYVICIEGVNITKLIKKFTVINNLKDTYDLAKKANSTATEAKSLATNGYVLDKVLTVTYPVTSNSVTVSVPEYTVAAIPIIADQSSISNSHFVKKTMVGISAEKSQATITALYQQWKSGGTTLSGNIIYRLLCFKKTTRF